MESTARTGNLVVSCLCKRRRLKLALQVFSGLQHARHGCVQCAGSLSCPMTQLRSWSSATFCRRQVLNAIVRGM